MKTQPKRYSALLVVLLIPVALYAQTTTYGRGQNQQTRYLLDRIDTKTQTFRSQMSQFLGGATPGITANRAENFDTMLTGFEQSIDSLRNGYRSRRDSSADVTNVLQQAAIINRFVERNSVNYQARNQWNSIRTDLETLARNYNV